MKNRIMLDLETFGSKPNSVITAIGAVRFGDGKFCDSFYERVCPSSCVKYGLDIDPETVMWWLAQANEARAEMTNSDRRELPIALSLFAAFAEVPTESAEVWGNGATFDNTVLKNAYDKCHMKAPWSFRNDMCYRTIKNRNPQIKMDRSGTHHNALDDARSQALHLMKILPDL